MHDDGVDLPCRFRKHPPFAPYYTNGNAIGITTARARTSRCEIRFCGLCFLNVTDRHSEEAELQK